MSVHEISCNPFQAPVVEPEVVRKEPADIEVPFGEYRIFDNKLLISGDTTLPPVCVRTGDTEDLVLREANVYFGSESVIAGAFSSFFFMLATLSIGNASMMFGSQFRPYSEEVSFTIFIGLLSGLGIVFDVAFRGLRCPTKIVYYESREWRTHRNRTYRIIVCVLTACLIVAGAAVWRFGDTPILFSFLMFPPMLFIFPSRFIGARRYRGYVHVLSGLPLDFLRDTPFPDQQNWVITEADNANRDATEREDVWV